MTAYTLTRVDGRPVLTCRACRTTLRCVNDAHARRAKLEHATDCPTRPGDAT